MLLQYNLPMFKIATASLLFLMVALTGFSQTVWNPFEQDISFKIKNGGITVTGHFNGWRGELIFNPNDLAGSKLKSSVQVSTIKTGIGLRDEHLLGETYFNADSFKTIEITSSKLYIKDVHYAGLFNVTIKGVTKEVEIPFDFNQFGNETEFRGSFKIDRHDFGVGGKSMTMANEVEIIIVIKAKKKLD